MNDPGESETTERGCHQTLTRPAMGKDYRNRVGLLAKERDEMHGKLVATRLERGRIVGKRVDVFLGLAPAALARFSDEAASNVSP